MFEEEKLTKLSLLLYRIEVKISSNYPIWSFQRPAFIHARCQ